MRWWNVKHPAAYAQRVVSGVSPGAGREILDDVQRREEQILLGVRLAQGLSIDHPAVTEFVGHGLAEPGPALHGQVVLTRHGRLLADTVVRRLLDQ